MQVKSESVPLTPFIRKAAVLGAGVMGAQIAAHLTNAGIVTILYDLASNTENKSQVVEQALLGLLKIHPAPLALSSNLHQIGAANYDEHLSELGSCDLVIEAISEKMEWKQSLYQKIVPYLKPSVIFGSNTSGLSIESLKQVLPENLQSRFLGVHFFNPPRYMKLVEIIPHSQTDKAMMGHLETFLVSTLGKGVVYAKDTPNFIGNRVGVFAILSMLEHAEKFHIPPDLVDDLTGPLIGRPKSATFRTMDIVGLDTMLHVVRTMKDGLPDDPWKAFFKVPKWLESLVDKGALGQKNGVGVYKKDAKGIMVFDSKHQDYRPATVKANPEVVAILKEPNIAKRFEALRAHPSNEAKFLWACFRDLFAYCAYHLQEIAHTCRDVDLALRWGYGWNIGPFELWQLAGWTEVSQWLTQDIQADLALTKTALPSWVSKVTSVYQDAKSYSPDANKFEGRSDLPVYQKQYFYEPMIGDTFNEGKTVMETDAVRLWTLDDEIVVLNFKSKLNCVGGDVLEGILQSIKIAEQQYKGLVIWQRHGSDFSVGANLKQFSETFKAQDFSLLTSAVKKFQETTLALRYCSIPTVAAISGRVLGGGCEIVLHCDHVVAALETYIGLVEVGVGLLPAAGGCKEMAYKASKEMVGTDLFGALKPYFEQIAMAKVSSSAFEAQEMGYLKASDTIVFNANELLHSAIKQAKVLSDVGYRPPMPPKFKVCGKAGIANFKAALVNMREGNFISDHDFDIGVKVATILCGGEVESNTVVDLPWMMALELDAFVELAKTQKTQERILYTLEKGKPLRN